MCNKYTKREQNKNNKKITVSFRLSPFPSHPPSLYLSHAPPPLPSARHFLGRLATKLMRRALNFPDVSLALTLSNVSCVICKGTLSRGRCTACSALAAVSLPSRGIFFFTSSILTCLMEIKCATTGFPAFRACSSSRAQAPSHLSVVVVWWCHERGRMLP